MPLSTHGASLLYRRLGRTPPRPGLVSAAPPKASLSEAQYNARVAAMWKQWSDVVEDIGRGVTRSDSARADATELERQLLAAYEALVQASGLSAWLKRAGKGIADRQADYTARVTKLPPQGQSGRNVAIEEFRERNVRLVTKLGEDHVRELADILRPAQGLGKRWEEIVPQIQERLGVGQSRARLIARDQTNKFNGEMQRLTQTESGVERYRWLTAGDFAVRGRPGGVNTRPGGEDHWALHGEVFEWRSPPLIPGTSERSHPGGRIQCRCQAVPIIPLFE